MKLDIDRYLPFLKGMDISQDQKISILHTVWGMMESQVDQAFGKHQVQLAKESRKKPLAEIRKRRIDSKHPKVKTRFNRVSIKSDARERKAST